MDAVSYEEPDAFGHKRHEHMLSHDWVLYDWRQYMDQPEGWCPGRCDISRTIDLYGVWEVDDTTRFVECLAEPSNGEVVIDVGANVGWYSILAAHMGFKVHAVEGCTETLDLLMENAGRVGLGASVTPHRAHWGSGTELSWDLIDVPVRLVKIDIEGNEPDAVRVLAPLFENRLVRYAMIEVSPVFGPHYKPMVQQMFDYGYRADIGGVRLTSSRLDVDQANVWFERKP